MTTCSLSPAYQPGAYHDLRPSQTAVRQSSERQASAPSTASAALAARMTETNASLTVTTGDGDVVTLTFSAQELMAAMQFSAEEGDSSVAGEARAGARSAGLSVSVQGDLDKEEMSDITRLFKKFARALRDVFRGRPERAAERMARTRGIESLSSFTYSMSRESQTLAQSLQQSG